MRRTDREKDAAFALDVIDRSHWAALATVNEDGTPYCIGLNVARAENTLYFHCAKEGQKLENLLRNPAVCLLFVCYANPTRFTCEYKSAVVTGTARAVLDAEGKKRAMERICQHFTPEHMGNFKRSMSASQEKMMVWQVDIETLSGKENKLPD